MSGHGVTTQRLCEVWEKHNTMCVTRLLERTGGIEWRKRQTDHLSEIDDATLIYVGFPC